MPGETLKEMVVHIEETLGEWNIEEDIVFMRADHAMNKLNVQRGMMEKQDQNIEEKLVGLKAKLLSVKEDFKQSLQI